MTSIVATYTSRATRYLHNVGKVWRRLSFAIGDSVSVFRVKLGANDLNCVDVPLTLYRMVMPIGTPFLKEKNNN